MSTYYVSNKGCDTNDGLSPEKAFATVIKLREVLKGGDTVLLHCGDTFYGQIKLPAGISPEQPTSVGSYGEGAKPTLSQYKIANADAWEQVSEKVYKLDLTDTAKFTGNTSEINTNVGFLKVSNKIFPHKIFELEKLAAQWDFYNDDRYVFVYSEKNPSELSDDIRFACQIGCIPFTTHMKVENIIIRGTGAHGINGVSNGAYIYNCEFHEIGGSELNGFPTPNTRYGNGVECWANSANITVDHCKFSGVYDVAITMQGRPVKTSWTNMHFTNNIMWNNQHCFEIWSSGDVPDTGFVDCHFENNLCIESGYGWSYAVRPDKTASTHLLLYGIGCPLCDITVTGNTFVNARNMTVFKAGGVCQMPKDYKIFGNTIICPEGQPLAWKDKTSDEEYDAYIKKLEEENTVYRHTVFTL